MNASENQVYRQMAIAEVRRQKVCVIYRLREQAFWPETCWIWPGKLDKYGRGYVEIANRRYNIPRLVMQMSGGLPHGLQALHRCDEPACFRGLHLFAGTQAENMKDMQSKQRGRKAGMSVRK